MEFNPDIAKIILDRIANGESLRSICASDGIPARSEIYVWLSDNAGFADQYARARDEQADSYADEIAAIADDESIPADSRRIRIDARKWIACKLKPKKYGDKTAHELSGPNGGAIPIEKVERTIVHPAD